MAATTVTKYHEEPNEALKHHLEVVARIQKSLIERHMRGEIDLTDGIEKFLPKKDKSVVA